MENDHKCYRKGYGFLSQMCIKVILPCPQSEKGGNIQYMQSAYFYYYTLYLQAKVSPLKIALVEILLPTINRRGIGIRMSWVENS